MFNMPADLSLEPKDALTMYQALAHFAPTSQGVQDLKPASYFKSSTNGLLTQKDVLRYEADLKAEFARLSKRNDTLRHKVVHRLLASGSLTASASEDMNVAPSEETFYKNILPMLQKLDSNGDLPAILFNMDQNICEEIGKGILAAEKAWKAYSKSWALKIAKFEAWKQRVSRNARDQKNKSQAAVKEGLALQAGWESTFDPDAPPEEFSFAANHLYSKSDLDSDIRSLSKTTSTPRWALNLLYLGVAVHHAGMDKDYRALIESLFRKGFLRVMISTRTLALGSNVSAKTSVFCGDSIFLTSLTYRQCAGRAGRRGIDHVGKVVFYGVSLDRVKRIIRSKPPLLQGSFSLSATLCLRFLQLLEGSQRPKFASDCIGNLLSMPQIVFNGQQYGGQQLRNHFRFSLEYLQRARLIDKKGRAIDSLSSMAAHLHSTEPSNFAFAILLRHKVFHQLCEASGADWVSAKRNFIELLANLFGRRYLPQAQSSSKEELRKQSSSNVVLSPIKANSPIAHLADAYDVLSQHENETLETFKSYASASLAQNADTLGADVELPLSGLRFTGSPSTPDSDFRQNLRQYAATSENRYISAFVMNSGWTESDLHGVRSGLHLNANTVPSFRSLYSNKRELNAYILDFFKHGRVKASNGIGLGELWDLFREFSTTLVTIRVAMEEVFTAHAATVEVEEWELDGDEDEEWKEKEKDIDWEDEWDDEDRKSKDAATTQNATDTGFKRPYGVDDAEWKVYELVRDAAVDFNVNMGLEGAGGSRVFGH